MCSMLSCLQNQPRNCSWSSSVNPVKVRFATLQLVAGDFLPLQLISRWQWSIHLEKMIALEGELYGNIPCWGPSSSHREKMAGLGVGHHNQTLSLPQSLLSAGSTPNLQEFLYWDLARSLLNDLVSTHSRNISKLKSQFSSFTKIKLISFPLTSWHNNSTGSRKAMYSSLIVLLTDPQIHFHLFGG